MNFMRDNKIKVLLVEDNPGDARLIQEMLSEAGAPAFAMAQADMLSTGLERLAAGGIDAVLLDLGLPDSSGLDTFITVHAQAPDVPIVVLTGLDDAELAITVVQEGAQDYLPKNKLDSELLVRTIRYAIERKKVENALNESENRLNIIFESAPDAYYINDFEGVVIDGNKAAEELLGYSREELIGKNLVDAGLLSMDEVEKAVKLLAENINGKSTGPEEFTLKRKDGTKVNVEILNHPVKIGGEDRVLGIARDITKRKHAEEALQANQLKYRQLFETMTSGVAIYEVVDDGNDFIFKDFNRAGENIEKVKREDVIGRRVTEAFSGVSEFGLFKVFQRVWRTGKQEYFPEAIYRDEHDPGTWRENWVYKLPSGEIVSVYNDITERKQMEEELLVKNEVFEASITANSTLDNEGILTYVNNSFGKIWGYENKEEVVGKPISDFLKFEAEAMNIITALNETGEWEGEYTGLRKDKTTFNAYGLGTIIKDASGNTIGYQSAVQDISDRKRMEETLRESEGKYSSVVENSMDGIIVLQKGIIKFLNQAILDLSGYNPEELIDKEFENILSPEYRKLVMDRYPARLAGKNVPSMYDMEIIRKDGISVPIEVSSTTITYGGEKATLSFIRNITERKQAEELMIIEKNQAQQYLDIAGVMLIALDENGAITLINRKGCQILGYDESKIVNKNWFDLCIPEDIRDDIREVFSKLMAGEIAQVEYYDNVVITSSGEQKIIAFHNTIIRNKGSRITGILFSGEDITERKHADEALRIERDNLKNIFEAMEDGIYIVNQHYDIQYVNPVLKKDFGAYEGRKCYEYFHDLTEVCPWCKSLDVFAGKTVQWEWYSSKNQRTYDLVDTPLKNPDGSISKLEIFRDITERKQAEEQLKASLKEKEILLLEIHHRVKNNLQVVSSLLNLQARAAKDDNTRAGLLESRDRINTMALIHTKLYESGNLSEINMKGFVDGLIRQLFMGYQVQDTKIIPVVHVANCTLPISIAVPFGLVVNELLSNAFKHAFVNRDEGKIEVSLSASEKGAVRLTVSDDGVGLPEGFDFNTTKTLGLHLVKILVEDQLQGKMEIISEKGTTFTIAFEVEE